jgi:hypothetical protein
LPLQGNFSAYRRLFKFGFKRRLSLRNGSPILRFRHADTESPVILAFGFNAGPVAVCIARVLGFIKPLTGSEYK